MTVMPIRADIEAATPRCVRQVMIRKGQHGIHTMCFRPMCYDAAHEMWVCECGSSRAGWEIASRRLEAEYMPMVEQAA